MRKILFLFVLILSLGFVACGDDDKKGSCDGEPSIYCKDGKIYQPAIVLAQDIAVINWTSTVAVEPNLASGKHLGLNLAENSRSNASLLSQKGIIEKDGWKFKDLSGDGELQPYEDWRLDPWERALDLSERMSMAQRYGVLGIPFNPLGNTSHFTRPAGATYPQEASLEVDHLTGTSFTNFFSTHNIRFGLMHSHLGSTGTTTFHVNANQVLAEQYGLGVPFVYTNDPSTVWGSNAASTNFEKQQNNWQNNNYITMLGYGAIGDVDYFYNHALIHAQEYITAGWRMTLGPMTDPMGEPRWARVYDVVGSDPAFVAAMMGAYYRAQQGQRHGLDGLLKMAVMAKHMPGAGANSGGSDSHRSHGKWSVHYPGGIEGHGVPLTTKWRRAGTLGSRNFADTEGSWPGFAVLIDIFVRPLLTEVYPMAIMPCYSTYRDPWMPMTYTSGVTGKVFNPLYIASAIDEVLMMDLYREELEWNGAMCTDWGAHEGSGALSSAAGYMLEDSALQAPFNAQFNPWGLGRPLLAGEGQNIRQERLAEAQLMQVGGQNGANVWGPAVIDGFVSEDYIKWAAAKCIEVYFVRVGMLENPYSDPVEFEKAYTAGAAAALESHRRALVLLKNDDGANAVLPLQNAPGRTFYYNGVTVRNAGAAMLFEGFGLSEDQVLNEANAGNADIQIIRISSRRGHYFGIPGGVPLSFGDPTRLYLRGGYGAIGGLGGEGGMLTHGYSDAHRESGFSQGFPYTNTGRYGTSGHETDLEWMDRMAREVAAATSIEFDSTTRVTSSITPSITSNIIDHTTSVYNANATPGDNTVPFARLNGQKLFNAIERKKLDSKLIVVIFINRPFIFGSRPTGELLTGADAGKGEPGFNIREVSTLKRWTDRAWTDATTYNGTNLYDPSVDQAALGLPDSNPITLVNRLKVGGLTRITELPNGVKRGTVLYVDPVAAAGWVANPGSPTSEEQAALRVLQYNGTGNSGSPASGVSNIVTFGINPLQQVEFIDNPLDYIDGFILDFGIEDNQLIACLFGRDGLAPNAPRYKPRATLPFAIYNTNTQVEKQWEDLPCDIPTKDGYKDYLGFKFGLRAGLVNHPSGAGWQRGQASAQNNWNWTWPRPNYLRRVGQN